MNELQPIASPSAQPVQSGPGVITHGPSFAMLRVDLAPGQELVAEAGSMVAKQAAISMETKLNAPRSGGFLAMLTAMFVAFIRKLVGGESFFVNHFSSTQPASVWIAPALSGNITHRRLQGETLVLSSGAYLASIGPLDMKMRWGGLRGLLAKEGLFFLEISGHGDLWFTSYGGIEPIDVNGSLVVDNGHLVGYEGQLTFDIRTSGGGLLGFVASGEGMVCEFRGQGRLWIQSRNLPALVDWITPHFLR